MFLSLHAGASAKQIDTIPTVLVGCPGGEVEKDCRYIHLSPYPPSEIYKVVALSIYGSIVSSKKTFKFRRSRSIRGCVPLYHYN
jgi:hypothetical protein